MIISCNIVSFGADEDTTTSLFNDEQLNKGYQHAINNNNLDCIEKSSADKKIISWYRVGGYVDVEIMDGVVQSMPYYIVENYTLPKDAVNMAFFKSEFRGTISYYPVVLFENGTVEQCSLPVSSVINCNDNTTSHPNTSAHPSAPTNQMATFLQCEFPIFNSLDDCNKYLNEHVIPDDSIYLPSAIRCEKPIGIALYNDNNNKYLINLVWYQDNITSSYLSTINYVYAYSIDGVLGNGTVITVDTSYLTKKDNHIQFDITDIVDNAMLGKVNDVVKILVGVKNRDTSGLLLDSDICTISFSVTTDGIYYCPIDDSNTSVEGSTLMKNETQFKNDNGYKPSDFTTYDNYSNDGFINAIISGFGLIGDKGLLPLISSCFSFVPPFIWVLIGAGISFKIIISLFKMLF